jgi:tetrapyrrole methylase family protein / MazG family protein
MSTPAASSFDRLFAIIQKLRSPEGCPWDREQSPRTLRGNLIDEAWECVSAIDAGDDANMREELGDLYLLVTMLAWMKEQEGSFSVEATLQGISEKLIRRHPHVFGASTVTGVGEVLTQWDAIKAEEKKHAPGGHSALDKVPRSVPPLEKAAELQKKAAKVGFDWPETEPIYDKITEEIAELRHALAAGDKTEAEAELGDLLFSVVNLARSLRIDPSVALNRTNVKFERRFRSVERHIAAQGMTMKEAGLEKMDAAWNQVKLEETASEGKATSK